MATRKNVVIEQSDEDFDPTTEVDTNDQIAVPVEVLTDEDQDEKEYVLVVTAVSSSGTRSTRNASGKIKKALPEGGTLYAVEVSREAIPNWRIQNYWLSKDEAEEVAETTAESGSGRNGKPNGTGGQVMAAQVVEAKAVLVEVTH